MEKAKCNEICDKEYKIINLVQKHKKILTSYGGLMAGQAEQQK
jgi:hypothetical protein